MRRKAQSPALQGVGTWQGGKGEWGEGIEGQWEARG